MKKDKIEHIKVDVVESEGDQLDNFQPSDGLIETMAFDEDQQEKNEE